MACHEVAALRLGLMNILGIDDPAERQHELAELGAACESKGPLRSLLEAKDLASLQRNFEASLLDLERKVSVAKADDPKLPYLRSLMILTKQVELTLRRETESLRGLYLELEQMHDFTHEIFPAN